jgi:hypothetical protein
MEIETQAIQEHSQGHLGPTAGLGSRHAAFKILAQFRTMGCEIINVPPHFSLITEIPSTELIVHENEDFCLLQKLVTTCYGYSKLSPVCWN